MTSDTDGEPIIRRLAVGGSEPVLVADFDAFSDAPNLSVLLADLVSDRPVYQVDPVAVLSGQRRYLPLSALAETAVAAFTPSAQNGGRVFVVGYCSAAGLAVRIAGLLAPAHDVTVILANPTWADDRLVTAVFDDIGRHIGGEIPSCPDLRAAPDSVLETMEAALAAQLAALAERMGLQASAGPFGDLLDRYRSWLAFLLACHADPRPEVSHGVAVRELGGRDQAPDLAALVLAQITEATASA